MTPKTASRCAVVTLTCSAFTVVSVLNTSSAQQPPATIAAVANKNGPSAMPRVKSLAYVEQT